MARVSTRERRAAFESFFREAEPRLGRALTAAYGSEVGHEATAEALAYAWEHWDRIREMQNPIGYLYRVGQSRSRRWRRGARRFPAVTEQREAWFEPELPRALVTLSRNQRVAVVLVFGFGWTHREVAELTGTSSSTVQNHVERGLAKLRAALKVDSDA